jgi:exodeoxyribonuclease V alpha subunit
VIYQNGENGYTVLRLESEDGEPVTVVGCLPFSAPGERLSLGGVWERHPSHGEQFRARWARRSLPVGARAIYEYLASRTVKGIGPATASLIVTRFGDKSLEVIADQPERLAEIRGFSRKKAFEISEIFRRQAGLRYLMEFLSTNGLRPEYAMRLYKIYGDGAMALLRENPYLLAADRVGGRFDEADALALALGFEGDSPQRVAAAILFELTHNLNNGHSFLPRDKLLAATAELIDVPVESVGECLQALLDEGEVVCETVAGVEGCYLDRLYRAETYSAARLLELAGKTLKCHLDTDALAERLEGEQQISYAPLQRRALALAAERQLLVITGGPGTGKTTALRAILALYSEMGVECLLAAPTGRAAKRMSELSGREAATVHRLLGAGWMPDGDELQFRKNEDDPLDCGAVILDECSMVDVTLLRALLAAMPRECRLVLVGDADQLPSVGPGCVFRDILRSGAVASVRLTEIFRQGRESRIVRNAHMINRGECPDLKENDGDFFFLRRTDGERAAVTNVGVRPTVGGEDLTVESYILDYSGNLYGKPVRLEFHDFLRPERCFDDVEQLKEQIRRDVQRVRELFAAPAPKESSVKP